MHPFRLDAAADGGSLQPAASRPVGGDGEFSYSSPEQSKLQRALIRAVEQIGGQRRLRLLYESRLENRQDGESFFDTAVRLLCLDVRFDPDALAAVPASGPVLFIANHPFGILDGIVLAWLAMKVRPDTKVLAHVALNRVPEARPNLLPVDFAETPAALETNLATRRTAMEWLGGGHAVGIFPGGAVSTIERWSGKWALDLPWAPFTAKLIRATKATVVPVHFSGQNSRMFQLASQVSVTLRLSLIMHETARRIGTPLDVAIGEPIPPGDLAGLADRSALLMELRRRTYELAPGGRKDWMRTGRIRMPKRDRPGDDPAAAPRALPR